MGNALESCGSPAPVRTEDLEAVSRYRETSPGGDAPVSDLPEAPPEPRRVRCASGGRCKCREAAHLAEEAHPFDPEYAQLCRNENVQAEEPSLRLLFDWVDTDGSGKISRPELIDALPLLSRLFRVKVEICDEAWERLDEDGNGCVNFSEFAEWAGPRLGLPLGVKRLFQAASGPAANACAIVGCPCEDFQPKPTETRLRDDKGRLLTGSLWVAAFARTERGKDRLQICKCGHKHSAHSTESRLPGADTDDVPLPLYWESRRRSPNATFFSELVPETEQVTRFFQGVFDGTYRPIWTRDRRKHNAENERVPKGFQVVRAWRCENRKFWREYGVRRAQMLEDRLLTDADSFHMYEDVKTVVAWEKHAESMSTSSIARELIRDCNEWYLFHGTSPERAENICHNDFKISMAGGNTGTLYGRGTYFAESITKADEYAKPNEDGDYAMLLVRALGGRVKYTDEVEPDAEKLVRDCIEGPYDCILGDREKCRNTYREFVFYDTENIYAEYIVHYRRIY